MRHPTDRASRTWDGPECEHLWYPFNGPIHMVIPDGHVLQKCDRCQEMRTVHRLSHVSDIRSKIKAGTYKTPEKLAIANERAMAAALGPNDVDGAPLLRLGPGGDFTRDIHAHDLLPPLPPSSANAGGGASVENGGPTDE